MCPLKYLYHVLLFLLTSAFLSSCAEWKAFFEPRDVQIKTLTSKRIRVILSGLPEEAIANINDRTYLQLKSEHDDRATVKNQQEIKFYELDRNSNSWDAHFDISGVFLGMIFFDNYQ